MQNITRVDCASMLLAGGGKDDDGTAVQGGSAQQLHEGRGDQVSERAADSLQNWKFSF